MNTKQNSIADKYVGTVNQQDPTGYLALFADEAVVDDGGREFRGLEAIKAWSESDIFAVQVSFEVIDQTETKDEVNITTKVDGTFDHTGLPDPVIITHHIIHDGDKISSLTCRLAD